MPVQPLPSEPGRFESVYLHQSETGAASTAPASDHKPRMEDQGRRLLVGWNFGRVVPEVEHRGFPVPGHRLDDGVCKLDSLEMVRANDTVVVEGEAVIKTNTLLSEIKIVHKYYLKVPISER